MKTSLVIALAATLVAFTGCNKSTRSNSANNADYTAPGNATTDSSVNAATDRMGNDLHDAANSASSAINSAASNVAVSARMAQWNLNANDIQADLANGNDIVRTKTSEAGAPTGNIDKDTLESAVKGHFASDAQVSSLNLDVDAKKDGSVKLSGKAQTADQVGRAIALALDTQGVNKVTSKIKLENK